MRCFEVPRNTYPFIIPSLLRLGQTDEAEAAFKKGMQGLSQSERTPPGLNVYLAYLGMARRFDEGFALLSSRMRAAIRTRNDARRLSFLRGAAVLTRAAELAGTGVAALTLPPTWEGFEPDGLYDVATLARRFKGEASALAKRFDARNGNTRLTDELKQDELALGDASD